MYTYISDDEGRHMAMITLLKKQKPTSSPRQDRLFIWPPFFQYNKRLLRQKTGGACLYMPQDGHWLASFEVIPPPKKLVFPRPKKRKFPTENCFPDPISF